MGQHRTKKEKQRSTYRRDKEIQNLYSLSHIKTVSPEKIATQHKSKVSSLFVFDKKYFYKDLLKTIVVSMIILVIEIILWQKFK